MKPNINKSCASRRDYKVITRFIRMMYCDNPILTIQYGEQSNYVTLSQFLKYKSKIYFSNSEKNHLRRFCLKKN